MIWINAYTDKPTNLETLDWLISNTANAIQDIKNEDYIWDHSLTEWKFQISKNQMKKYKNQKEA